MARIGENHTILTTDTAGTSLAAFATRETGMAVSHFLEIPEQGIARLWCWPTDAVDEDEQRLSAFALEARENTASIRLLNGWGGEISVSRLWQTSAVNLVLQMSHPDPAAMVTKAFRETLPTNAPLPWKRIVSAKWTKEAFPRVAVAKLEMFDGLAATVEVSEIDWGRVATGIHSSERVVSLSYGWLKMDGGACHLENGQWVRVPPEAELLAA
jgi:hypothetical protein